VADIITTPPHGTTTAVCTITTAGIATAVDMGTITATTVTDAAHS
jgi:hypothetical protein